MRQLNPKQLSAYSLLSTAFLALSNEASTQVVYTDIDPDFEINYGGHLFGSDELTFEIDFDHNGSTDVSFYFYSYAYNRIIYNSKYVSFVLDPASENSFMFDSLASESASGPAKLGAGVKVGPVANWHNKFSSTMFYDYWYRSFLVQSSSSSGNWKSADQNFAGIKFKINGETHFGWVRLSLEQYPGKKPSGVITIHDYAYEATPNKLITTPIQLSPADQLQLSTNENNYLQLNFFTPLNNNAIEEYRIFLVPAYNINDVNIKALQLNNHFTEVKNMDPGMALSVRLENKDWNGAPLTAGINYHAYVLSMNTSFFANDLNVSEGSNPVMFELKEEITGVTGTEITIFSVADVVHLNFTDETYTGAIARIFTIDGKELMEQTITGMENELKVVGAKGVYLIQIQNGASMINKKVHIAG